MKGQTLEMLGFLALSITIIVVILFMRRYLATGYGESFSRLVERQEIEGQRAGTVSILQTTEEKTEKTLLELLGLVAFQTDWSLDFGPSTGSVDISEEITWRMNEIYGENKWYIKIPYPDVIPRYQIIMVIDTSGSLCDDFQNIKVNLPLVIETLRGEGYNVAATIFMLPGGAECCEGGTLSCEGSFSTKKYLHCIDMDNSECRSYGISIQNEEDWGRGLACGILRGPYEGWYDFTAKIGIVLSDELPTGSASTAGRTQDNDESLGVAIDYATENEAPDITMNVFPFKAKTDDPVCIQGYPDMITCTDCIVNSYHLTDSMNQLADVTGGELYELANAQDAPDKIAEIFTDHQFEVGQYMELGNLPPKGKDINSVTLTIPVPYVGEYANIYIKTWV